MSASYEIKGIVPNDHRFHEMKAIWELCEKSNVSIPDEVIDFFDGENPENKFGLELDIKQAVHEFTSDMSVVHRIDLSKLPTIVKFIDFEISY